MKKKISGITKASVAALLAAGVIFPATTSAAPGDIWKLNTDGTKTNLGSGGQIFLQSGLAGLLDIQTNPTNYFYEGPKELYTFSDADSVFNANPNLSTEEIQEKLEQELAGKGEEIPAQTLDIQSVSAVNPTTVKVTFNQAVEALTKADVTITDAKTLDKKYIKEVTLSTDKLSAEVVLYEALTDKTTYKVVAAGAESQFDYVVGSVASITADANQVVQAGKVDLTKLKYVVSDANGLDITSTTEVQFESSETIESDGKTIQNFTAGKTAFVYVVATKADGTTVKSNRITITAAASSLAQITNYTVGTTEPNFSATDYKQNLNVQMDVTGQKLYIEGKDQFGEKVELTGVTYESLDTDIAIVDKMTGAITPLKEGTLPVRITAGDFKQTVELQVVAKGVASTVEFDKQSVSISNKVTTPTTVKVTVKDQYGTVVTNVKATAEVTSGKDLVKVDLPTLTNGEGTLSITPVAGKTGTAVVEVKVSDTVKASVTVNITEAGVVDNYIVEGFKTTLDKNAAETNKNKNMTLSAFPVDADGIKTGDAVSATYTVYDKDNAAVETLEDVSTSTPIEATNAKLPEGTYTVKVKVGSLEVYTDTFNVVDTSEKPIVEVTSNKVSASAKDVLSKIAKNLKVTYGGTELTLTENNVAPTAKGQYQISKITFISDNSAVIASATDATSITAGVGSANLTVQSVEITHYDGAKAVALPVIPLNETFTVETVTETATDWQKYFNFQTASGVNANTGVDFDAIHDLGGLAPSDGKVTLVAENGKIVAKVTGTVQTNVLTSAKETVADVDGATEAVAVALYFGESNESGKGYAKEAYYFAVNKDGQWAKRTKTVFENVEIQIPGGEKITVDIDLSGLTIVEI